uniref:Uncharacterized protein n=1 Tax=Lepeophtheirus salmonis TaxID=72036 RepID=A0A0K2TDI7_LEPSM
MMAKREKRLMNTDQTLLVMTTHVMWT